MKNAGSTQCRGSERQIKGAVKFEIDSTTNVRREEVRSSCKLRRTKKGVSPFVR